MHTTKPAYSFMSPRTTTLLGSVLVSLSSGTFYAFSAYAPQLGAKLHITHTQLNIIAFAGSLGSYGTGPIWGRIVDTRGPQIPFICALTLLFAGYMGIRSFYNGLFTLSETPHTLSPSFIMLCTFQLFCAAGGNAGLQASINSTAKSFPDQSRASATALVVAGYGLSAFIFSTAAHTVFPGDTSSFLLLLALGTSTPMLVGLWIVRPIPLYESGTIGRVDTGLYEPISSVDDSSELSHSTELPTLVDTPSPLLIPSPSPVGRQTAVQIDLHGRKLLGHRDFWVLFGILSLLAGTGLMYISNAGSITQALLAKGYPSWTVEMGAQLQAAQVSIISINNCLGRVVIGLVSDFARNKYRVPRAHFLCVVSMLFLLSQLILLETDDAQYLWIASSLIGFSYGAAFGLSTVVCMEWFGLAHFSQNWGYAAISPGIAGTIFGLAFGYNVDSHISHGDTAGLASRLLPGLGRLAPSLRDVHSSAAGQCLEGRLCYGESLGLTTAACTAALGLSVYAAWHKSREVTSKILWDDEEEVEMG